MSALTPRATLQYIAALRLPRSTPRAELDAHVANLLSTLGLSGCADAPVGDGVVVKGLSGGQRKRVSIAMELVRWLP